MNTLRNYFQDLMYDKRSDLLSQVIKPVLLLVSYLYGFMISWNHFFYKVNLLKSHKVPSRVFSIGNITLGGTGKTPFAIMLARRLANKGKKVALLTRGYGEDEWKLLKDRLDLPNVEVFVGKNGIKNAKKAKEDGFDNIVLDDGFQHTRLTRDCDIVLVNSTDPFGNRHLFPRGILREPATSLGRSDIIVLTKADKGEKELPILEEEIERVAPGKVIIKATHKPKRLIEIKTKETLGLDYLNNKSVCIISAICDPSYFKYTVGKTGAVIKEEFVFPDHYPYKTKDLSKIFRACKNKNIDTIITTEKDAVKLEKLDTSGDFRILALAIELEINEGEEKLDDILH